MSSTIKRIKVDRTKPFATVGSKGEVSVWRENEEIVEVKVNLHGLGWAYVGMEEAMTQEALWREGSIAPQAGQQEEGKEEVNKLMERVGRFPQSPLCNYLSDLCAFALRMLNDARIVAKAVWLGRAKELTREAKGWRKLIEGRFEAVEPPLLEQKR